MAIHIRRAGMPSVESSGPLADVEFGAAMCVLASGSGGNCTAIVVKRGMVRRVVLIDLGLSPRKTFRMLAGLPGGGVRPDQIDDALVTHLDSDHFRLEWLRMLPSHTRLRMHARHARQIGLTDRGGAGGGAGGVRVFEDSFELGDGVVVRPLLMSHDEAGVATFRIDMPGAGGGSLGFCTDLGHVTDELVEHLTVDGGVDVLAIESNYCPRMQLASPRPEFLKRRIMGGSGHLSNQQALEAVRRVSPREHVVLLHLSRECNDPALVAEMHGGGRKGGGAEFALTIAEQFHPPRWVSLARSARPLTRLPVVVREKQAMLF
ncbi:MAG TPA: MBL fold metallo-hydrolase [Phycisphaerales bacterium]|nr:MBL fold metallo-hydrolase [Phycisphaerales bacterium]